MRKLLQSKKGVNLIIVAFSLVYAIVAIIIGFTITDAVSDPAQISNLFLAKDVGLTIQTIHALQDDLHYQYHLSYDRRNIQLYDQTIFVTLAEDEHSPEDSFIPTQYTYDPSVFIKMPLRGTFDAASFSIIKTNNEIEFKNGTLQDTSSELQKLQLKKTDLFVTVETFDTNRDLELIANDLQDTFRKKLASEKKDHELFIILHVSTQTDELSVRYSQRASFDIETIALSLHSALNELEDTNIADDVVAGSTIPSAIELQLPANIIEEQPLLVMLLLESGVEEVLQ